MALVHPSKPTIRSHKGELHPAVALLCGFGLLVVIATLIHALFSLL